MASPFRDPVFARLYVAQVLSLLGTGLLTAALSLAAWRLGGAAAAGVILGSILALKMVAYVALAPLAEVVTARVPRRTALVALDVIRLVLLVPLPFATAWWEIAVLTFLYFSAAAAFTPLFQSTIPDILPQKEDYARALGLSRVASTAETLLTPALTALALTVMAGRWIFLLAAACFIGSVTALLLAKPPPAAAAGKAPFLDRATRGLRIYLKTPRLRGLFLFNLALSLGLAWVLVDTVVFAGARLGDATHYYTLLMASYGTGAAIGAILTPRLLTRLTERRAMASGVFAFALLTPAILLPLPVPGLAALWAAFGVASSLVLTPGGLVLTRSSAAPDRAAVFAAQFSLSHAAWLGAYPLAGWLGGVLGPEDALVVLGVGAAAAGALALTVWPADDPECREHDHQALPGDHPHLAAHPATASRRHAHAFHIDDLHPRWNM